MPSKFDTNPLDPQFPDTVRDKVRDAETKVLPKSDFSTGAFPPASITEEPTRRFENAEFNQYQAPFNSPYDGQNIPAGYHPPQFAEMNRASSPVVPKTGIPEKWLVGLPYIPWYVGLIASIVILLVVPKSEAKVRFHAAQGLAAHVAILIVTAIFAGVGHVTSFANLGGDIFQLVTFVMLLIFAIKAWKGKPVHIEAISGLTEWIEEKIQSRN